MANPPEYLTSLFTSYAAEPAETRPFVTLTFAQSLDGKIAGAGGKQLPLSGPESMLMTHWLRTLHDGILVGSGTALNDNPQLNTRLLPPAPADAPDRNPRPIIIDSRLRLPPTCKLLNNYKAGTGRQPWVVSSEPSQRDAEWEARRDALTAAGARVLLLPEHSSAARIPALLTLLRAEGIRTLMVEGGAAVISAFGACATTCVNTILITTAPRLVGAAGVGYEMPEQDDEHGFHTVETRLVGRDSVVALRRDA
ncbi:dihydrofolate reductase-like domain-containing protein [Mycena metata]|uniref:2,5-diamino-6-ribosylamino-4(3H)-pyrimidinone 5'-phosphate reductase n=1 Tax=Mycena metata TaxID=1033252 RepID=A0AAD7P3S5_9AGAR|nr:dihydrofolate reductase-like domain-containing protein [Mycena metata]